MSNINVKHLLRIDTWTNWSKTTTAGQGANLVLLKGEVGICTFEGTQKDANGIPVTEAVLFKVGDGTSAFSALKWVSGLAADVYAWAKKETPDWADFPYLPLTVVDNGTGKFVTDITYAQNKLTITRSNVAWGDISGKPNLVNSVKATGDTEITMTPSIAASGAVEITAEHAAHAAGSAKTASTATIGASYGATGTIKIPKIVTNEAGHVTEINEETVTIKMPAAQSLPTVNDGTLTLKASGGLNADQKTFSANDADNVTFEVAHGEKPTVGEAHPTTAGSGRTYVTKVDVDDFGHIAKVYTATEKDQTIPNITITDDTTPEVPTADTVNVYKNLTASGHTLTEELVTVPTKAYVDKKAAGAVDYLGTVSALTGLSTGAGKGDFYRVATAFGDCHAGDLLIAEKDGPAQLIDGTNWTLIHGDEGDITEVVAGNGLTNGGSTGSVTLNVGAGDGIDVTADKVSVRIEAGLTVNDDRYLNAKIGDGLEFGDIDEIKVKQGNHIVVNEDGVHHGAKPTTGTQHTTTSGSGRTYVTRVDVDSYGHIAKVYTATETVTNTDTWRPVQVNGTQLLGSAINTKPLNLVGGDNVTLTPDANNGKVTINSSDITVNDPAIIPSPVNGEFQAISSISADGHSLNSGYYTAVSPYGVDKRIADFHKKLATIATTGSVYDVAEGASANNGTDKDTNPKYLVFYGGTSTEVI